MRRLPLATLALVLLLPGCVVRQTRAPTPGHRAEYVMLLRPVEAIREFWRDDRTTASRTSSSRPPTPDPCIHSTSPDPSDPR